MDQIQDRISNMASTTLVTNMAAMARINVIERSNQNSIICLIKTYKSYTDTPDLNPTGSPRLACQYKTLPQFWPPNKRYLL